MINGNVKLYVKRGLNVRRGGQDNRESSSGSCSEDKPIEQSDEMCSIFADDLQEDLQACRLVALRWQQRRNGWLCPESW
jgi:hypothetical protein